MVSGIVRTPTSCTRCMMILNGFPLLSKLPANVTKSHYIYPPDYDLVFQSSEMMGHWVTNMHINASVLRAFPDAKSGLFV